MARSVFVFNTHDLPHRAGEMREYELDLSKSKSTDEEDIDLEVDDLSFMVGDEIDLEPAIRDAIILNMEVNPLCSEDCPGIEAKQGENWSYLPADQAQVPADPRWSALKDFPLKN